MKLKLIPALLFFLHLAHPFFAQKQVVDSLFGQLKALDGKADTNVYSVLFELATAYQQRDPDSAIYFYKRAIAVSEKMKDNLKKGDAMRAVAFVYFIKEDKPNAIKWCSEAIEIAGKELQENPASKEALKLRCKSFSVMGNVYFYTSEPDKALDYYRRAYKSAEQWGDKRHMGGMLNNMGLVYKAQSDYIKALDCFLKSLKINEELKDPFSMAKTLDNIGIIYLNQGEFDKALGYHERALKCAEESGNKSSMSAALVNIGVAYGSKRQEEKALEYYLKALRIDEEMGNPRYIAQDLSNVAIIHMHHKNFEKARETILRAFDIKRQMADKNELAITLGTLGELYVMAPGLAPPQGEKLKGYALAEKYFKEALQISHELNMLNEIKGFESLYSSLDTLRGNWRSAYYHYMNSVAARDTLNKEQNIKNQARLESKYEYDKKETVLKEQQAREMGIAQERNQRQRIIISGAVIGLLLVALFAVFVYRSLQTTRQQKLLIEKARDEVSSQKKMLEEKNREVLDSISYAKRIQEAILPGDKSWKKALPGSFVIYQPKDIVAGDFYWMEEQADHLFLAAADCTGHGVPGAMVSVVCSNALTRSVMEERITDSDKILNRVREIVKEKLNKNEDTIRDGMDICLVRLDRNKKQLQYSGANRPLFLMRNSELIEVKADKQPIGYYEDPKPFTAHNIDLLAGDTIYLFTDGYPDQFGGIKNKKLGNKALKQLLADIQSLSISQQEDRVRQFFESWKMSNEQVDDVCVIGVKI